MEHTVIHDFTAPMRMPSSIELDVPVKRQVVEHSVQLEDMETPDSPGPDQQVDSPNVTNRHTTLPQPESYPSLHNSSTGSMHSPTRSLLLPHSESCPLPAENIPDAHESFDMDCVSSSSLDEREARGEDEEEAYRPLCRLKPRLYFPLFQTC